MNIVEIYRNIVNAGINSSQTHAFSDKLQARNRLSFLCIVFSLIYFFYFLVHKQYLPFQAISFGISLFALSIILNQFQKFTISSSLILFNTNYCVLFFSIYLGFDSGIHLYLFTSPLIVLTLFDAKSVVFISMAMMSYVANFIILILIKNVFKLDFQILNNNQKDFFYLINFICSSVILMALALYFLYNNNKVNKLLLLKNQQLQFQQDQLKEENLIRKAEEKKATDSLKDREILLSEIHHRVKNNLAVVSGLLELQSSYIDDETTLQALKDSQNRVKSIALLHEKLYENKTLKEVNIKDYISELTHFIKQSYAPKKKEIKFQSQIENINLEMNMAMPFALLLNELMSNSYKHAFTSKEQGTIEINFIKQSNNYIFEYKDDGFGFDYDTEINKGSLGLNLIASFSEQLHGHFEFINKTSEMLFVLKF